MITMRWPLILLFLLLPAVAFANTFTVTTNADSGPGSLRDALQQARDNGTDARDSIIFNLPVSVASRTITLSGILFIPGNLVIDGSSEPAPAFGVSGAKIRIKSPGGFCSEGMHMDAVNDVAIYGLWISDFDITQVTCWGGGISIDKCKNFTLGAPGKGNVFTNDFYAVASWGGFFVSDSSATENIIVQSNFFGLDTAGEDDGKSVSASFGVTRNITVGGDGPGESNYFGNCAFSIGDSHNQPVYNNGFVRVINNYIDINYSKTNFFMPGYILVNGRYNVTSDLTVDISGNNFGVNSGGESISLSNITGNINIANNTFGQHIVNTSVGDGVIMDNCIKKDSISIHDNTWSGMHYPIQTDNAGITIRDNVIFCTQKGISINVHTPGIPVISVKQILPNSISGKTVPHGKVQIFFTDSCQELCENGQSLLANVNADALGNFIYTGPVHGLISATVTDGFGTTSEFNGVKANIYNAYVKGATCGKKNGSIIGITIANASSWYWEDTAGNKVGYDTSLVNLAPGKYQLVLREDNVNCDLLTGYYEILDEPKPTVDSSFSLVQPTCGQPNGEMHFKGHNTVNAYNGWLDSAGRVVRLYYGDVTDLPAGKYYYRLALFDDSTCYAVAGPLVLINQTGAALSTANVQITDASCGKKNGSIKNVTYQNASGTVYMAWQDSAGKAVSHTLDLLNVPAGKYRLKFKDSGGCDTITTAYYTVANAGVVTFDTSKMQVIQASCNGADGSVKGITSANTSAYAWVNTATTDTIGRTEDIAGLAAGSYQLYFTSNPGCRANTNNIQVTEKMLAYDTGKMVVVAASCKGSDGSIKGITSSNVTGYAWVNTATTDTVGRAEDIAGLPAGSYQLFFINSYGCTINTPGIKVDEKPLTLDTTKIVIKPSSCKGSDGSIQGITSTNTTIFTWINTATNNIVGNNEDINNIAPGNYRLTLSNSNGCNIKTNTINIPQAGFLTDTITQEIISDPNCDLDNGFVKPLKFTRDTALYTFQWMNDTTGKLLSTNTAVYGLAAGHYSLYATDINGCTQSIFNTPVKQHGKPVFVYDAVHITDDTCNTSVGTISNLQLKDIYRTYTWAWFNNAQQSFGSTPAGISKLPAGSYYAAVTDQFTCTVNSTPFAVKNYSLLLQNPQAANQQVQRSYATVIQVTNVRPGIYNLYDTANAAIPVSSSSAGTLVTPPVYYNKLFYIQYVKGDCASALQPVEIMVFDSTKISIPSAFSPNGDGINDTWRFKMQGIVANYSLTIFNRFGQSVFVTNDVNKQWDGTINGKPLPVGTYYYIAQCAGENGRPVKQSGYVVIVR